MEILKSFRHFDRNTNFFSFIIAVYYLSGISPWHHNPVQKISKVVIGIFIAAFWVLKVQDFHKYLVPFDLDKFIEGLSMPIFHFIGLFKFFVVVKDFSGFCEIMDFLNARSFKPDDDEIFIMRKQRFMSHRNMLLRLLAFSWLTVLITCFIITPLTDTLKIYFPQDGSPTYWCVYWFSFATHISSSALVISAGFFATHMILYIAFEFRVLAFSFAKLLNDIEDKPSENDYRKVLDELISYVKYYQKLLLIAKKLQKLLFFPLLFQLLLVVIMIILWLFEIASVDNYLSTTFSIRLNLIIAVTMEIFVSSYCGESIHHESQSISGAIYSSKWYQLNYSSPNKKDLKQLKAILTLTIMRANRPIKLSAGGFTTINFETFMTVYKFGYTMCNILIQARN